MKADIITHLERKEKQREIATERRENLRCKFLEKLLIYAGVFIFGFIYMYIIKLIVEVIYGFKG
jgi:hypothetical protein